jgi:hypothetical protein
MQLLFEHLTAIGNFKIGGSFDQQYHNCGDSKKQQQVSVATE